LLLGGKANPELSEAFREYLARLSRWLPPPDERASWTSQALLDLAAAIAGAVAGYLSFRTAAGLTSTASSIGSVLSVGVPQLLRRRRLGNDGAPT
jgi:hypothetical protein